MASGSPELGPLSGTLGQCPQPLRVGTVPACAVPGAGAVLSVLLSPAAVKGPGAELPLGPGGAGGDRVRHAATWRLPARPYWRK